MKAKQTVVVGLSGGVDSSVTALLLKQQGYRVIGLFMKNWDEEEECPWAKDHEDVTKIAEQLEIPCYTVNFTEAYWERVFSRCLEQFRLGHTPNPDILCNQEIKFKLFFNKALEIGADFVATGHYARNLDSRLARGVDESKDQSYFLYTLKEKTLDKVLFPLGKLRKSEVRALARMHHLVTAEKKDSVGICFIGKRNFKEFLSRYIQKERGPLMTLSGKVVGEHEGISYYTIGQRKGLAIGGAGEAWFVVGKDIVRNRVYVEQGEDHPALYHQALRAYEVSWVGQEPHFPLHCTAKIRYRSEDQKCIVTKTKEGELFVVFEKKQKAITVQQSIVFYQEEFCLGGAMIRERVDI